jgi:prenyltransferase beta subunit
MKRRTILSLGILLVFVVGALPVLAQADIPAALAYLGTQQNEDGGFGSGFSPESSVGSTADVVLAIIAAGGDPASFDQGGNTPLTFLANNASSAVTAGDLAKLTLAAIAAGENPRSFGDQDSVSRLEGLVGASGKIGGEMDNLVSHSLAVLALSSAQRPIPAAAVDYLKAAQQENGGWAWDGSTATASDTNTTAFAVQALVAAGESAEADPIVRAMSYYEGIQNADGGWPYQSPSDYGTSTDANSTAVTIQAILAAGQDPTGAEWTTAEGNTSLAALERLQNESGAFAWQEAMPDDNLLATVQALPAIAGKAFPLATMDVGQAVAAAPATVPETGGAVLHPALAVLASGLALLGSGLLLRRRR